MLGASLCFFSTLLPFTADGVDPDSDPTLEKNRIRIQVSKKIGSEPDPRNHPGSGSDLMNITLYFFIYI